MEEVIVQFFIPLPNFLQFFLTPPQCLKIFSRLHPQCLIEYCVIAKQDAKAEAKPYLPPRLFTKDDELEPDISIGIFSGSPKLFDALKTVLYKYEWDEIWYSRLGVFLQYHEQQISWASRLAHFMLSFQLVCNKKHEIWSVIGVTPIRFSLHEFEHITRRNCNYEENIMSLKVKVMDEMKEFWEQLGVGVEVGPNYEELVTSCKLCGDWERDELLRLGFLAILASCIDAHSHTQSIDVNLASLVMDLKKFVDYPWGRVAFKKLISSVKAMDFTNTYHINGFFQAFQSWVYFSLPEFAQEFVEPNPTKPTPPLLAYGGSKGRKNLSKGMLKQVYYHLYTHYLRLQVEV